MRKNATLLSVLLVLFSALAFAQVRTVTGKVTDAQGNPIPFASVIVRGTSTGVSADQTGNFSIQAATGNTLVISAAGYQDMSVVVPAQGPVSVTLTSGENLSEVVVTALGVRRTRNQVPYAAQQVTGEDVSKTRTANFIQNLSGKVSGLEIRQSNTLGGSTNVVIRGVKSLTGNNQALFVIDGVPVDNTNAKSGSQATGRGGYDYGSAASDINPDDIASITVLKGAAATALYGSQGGNGVILITTKRGQKGLGITVNTGLTVGKYDPSTFAKYQKEYGGGYCQCYEDNSGWFLWRDPNNGFAPVAASNPNGRPVVPLMEDASYGGPLDGSLVYQWNAFDPNSPFFGKPTPFLPAAHGGEAIFQTALSSNQNIIISGGSDVGTFKLGYTRNDDRGIMPNSTIQKNLVNFGGSYNITSQLTAAASVNYSGVKGVGRYGTGYDDKNLMTNFRQWFQTNVDVLEQKQAYEASKRNMTWNLTDPTDFSAIFWDNPYFTRYENYENDFRNRLFGSVTLSYRPTSWLNVEGLVGHDGYDEMQEERQAKGSTTTAGYTRINRNVVGTNYNLRANLDRDLSDMLNFKALIGTAVRKERRQLIAASTNGGLVADRIYSLSNSKNPINPPQESDLRREVWGNYAGATLTWNEMLTLDATIRNDQASTLPKGNNSYWYPSASLGFTFSRLLPTATWLSYGKVRANYAQVGNDAPIYSLADAYDVGTPYSGQPVGSVAGTRANPELRPEQTKSYEFGLEMAFLRNRLGFDLTYYDAKTFDQIFPVEISRATGYNAQYLNAGNIRNKGVELTAYGTPVQTRDFSWNINVNWTKNDNKVEELYPGIDAITLGTFQGGIAIVAALNQPYGQIRGSDFVYTNGQRTVKSNGRYAVTPESNIPIGNMNPDWIAGINNSLRYKNLSLSWLVDFRQGGDVFSLDLYYGLATGLYPETAGLNDLGNPSRSSLADGGGVIMPGVTADGKENTKRVSNGYGTYGYAYNPAAAFVYDASYVKLREAILTYSLPQSMFANSRIFKGIDLSLVGRNLWIIHKNIPYSDPEENISSGNLQGYQSGAYPTTRSLGFNARFSF
ncbi:MAG: SusC/RagA family TonB-linked outer membrane protein [Flavisolibacter sp.]